MENEKVVKAKFNRIDVWILFKDGTRELFDSFKKPEELNRKVTKRLSKYIKKNKDKITKYEVVNVHDKIED